MKNDKRQKRPPLNLSRRVPPNSVEAEIAVLGGILLSNEALDLVRDILKPEDFYTPANVKIYMAVCELYEKNQAIDPVTLGECLKSHGWWDEIGGDALILKLIDQTSSVANIEHYANIVLDKSQLRQMIDTTINIQQTIFDPQAEEIDAKQIIDLAQSQIMEVGQSGKRHEFITVEDMLNAGMRYMDLGQEAELPGAISGFNDLDKMITSFQPGQFILLAARPGMGKTSLAFQFSINIGCYLQKPVLFFSREMNKAQMTMRLICQECRIGLQAYQRRTYTEKDYAKVANMAQMISASPLLLDDSGKLTINDIRAKARRAKKQLGGLALVVIDYIQLISPDGKRQESREQEVAGQSRTLKNLSGELDCPVMGLSQLNRKVEERPDKRPKLSDLRESGSLEQDADLIMFLYRDCIYNEDTEEPNKTELILGKQRNGPTGKVNLSFLDWCCRFEDYTSRASGV